MPDFEWMASNIDKIVRADGVTGLIARNQAGWIDGPMDYIMKFENINEDIKPIMDMMGVQGTTLPHINKTMHADYRLYYNDNTRKLIAKAFEEDIERFKYQF